jgi:hypothetical protein
MSEQAVFEWFHAFITVIQADSSHYREAPHCLDFDFDHLGLDFLQLNSLDLNFTDLNSAVVDYVEADCPLSPANPDTFIYSCKLHK